MKARIEQFAKRAKVIVSAEDQDEKVRIEKIKKLACLDGERGELVIELSLTDYSGGSGGVGRGVFGL